MMTAKRRRLRSLILSSFMAGAAICGSTFSEGMALGQEDGFVPRGSRVARPLPNPQPETVTPWQGDQMERQAPARKPQTFHPPYGWQADNSHAKQEQKQVDSWTPRTGRGHIGKIHNRFTPWESREEDRWNHVNSRLLEKSYAESEAPAISRFILREQGQPQNAPNLDPPPILPDAIANVAPAPTDVPEKPERTYQTPVDPNTLSAAPAEEPEYVYEEVETHSVVSPEQLQPTPQEIASNDIAPQLEPAPAAEAPTTEDESSWQPAETETAEPQALAQLQPPAKLDPPPQLNPVPALASPAAESVDRKVNAGSTASTRLTPPIEEDTIESEVVVESEVSVEREVENAKEVSTDDVAERLRAVLRGAPSRRESRKNQEPAPIEVRETTPSHSSERQVSPMVPLIRDNPTVKTEPAETVEESYAPAIETPAAPEVANQPIQITAQVAAMKQPVTNVLRYYFNRPENMAQRSPWGTFHLMLPFGTDAKVQSGRNQYNSVAWLCGNRPCRGQRLMTTTRTGRIYVRQGVGLQGHQAQLLAMLAQINVSTDYPLVVGRKRFTVQNLIDAEMEDCKVNQELTFALIGLSHYLPTDSTWRGGDGTQWNFERVLGQELDQPIVGAACGGTHRLMSFSFALRQRKLEGLPIEGQWARASAFIEDFVDYAWTLQNADGSFSTSWFEGRADNRDIDRKIQTTGHILEWLVFTADQSELQDERFVRAVNFLTNAFTRYRTRKWEPGPKGHVLRSLALYHRRVYGEQAPWRNPAATQIAHRSR